MPSARTHTPRVLVIGAGSRGHAYARALHNSGEAIVQSVAEPIPFKRNDFIAKYIASASQTSAHEDAGFESWEDFLKYENVRRERAAAGETVLPGVDAIFVCTLDHTHRAIVEAFAPLGVHIMCEKPLATTLADCLAMYRALGGGGGAEKQKQILSIGHVLRYSPHNMMLRKMVREDRVVGDVLSVEHVEPVGWSHFSHSYVRGNWRKESTSGPSLLTKSCHDIDFLLWMLSSPPTSSPHDPPHLPSTVSSAGKLSYFKRSRKPAAAGSATNCLSCAAEPTCSYSARKIYEQGCLERGITGWPLKIVNPEIEECARALGVEAAREKLLGSLAEDYAADTPAEARDARGWYGRCVYESDNDVLDDQTVTITWEEEEGVTGKAAKTADFHMIAFTQAQCDRRGRIYGTEGEIEYDSFVIKVYRFATRQVETFTPKQEGGGHGGGDLGLARQFIRAVAGVMEGQEVEEAQREHVGCSLEEVIRSHAMVWAAEEARRGRKVVDWKDWWKANVETA